jgi:hypothetical protein
MEQSPFWEANRFSASQENPRVLWNPKVCYRFYKRPTSAPILSQINSVLVPLPLPEGYLNIILPSTPGSSMWFLSLTFPRQYPVCTSPRPAYVLYAHPCHSSRFDHPNDIWWGHNLQRCQIPVSVLRTITADSTFVHRIEHFVKNLGFKIFNPVSKTRNYNKHIW